MTSGNLVFQWNSSDVQIKTKSVEVALEPLVHQVTTLMNSGNDEDGCRKKGRSKSALVLAAAIERATEQFIQKGDEIVTDAPDEVKHELIDAIRQVRTNGGEMSLVASEFASAPCTPGLRHNLVRTARALLSAVARLLIVADQVDVHRLLASLRIVSRDLDDMKTARSSRELVSHFKSFGRDIVSLDGVAKMRQSDLLDPRSQEHIAAARAYLKSHAMLLLTASEAALAHPDLEATAANRDFVLAAMFRAIDDIGNCLVTRTASTAGVDSEETPGLARALNELEAVCGRPPTYNVARLRPVLESKLEAIISGAGHLADAPDTPAVRRQRIVESCNSVRQALQDLLQAYSQGSKSDSPALTHFFAATDTLRRQLRRAAADAVCEVLLDPESPSERLINAAKAQQPLNEQHLNDQINRIVHASDLTCAVSSDFDGVRLVRAAINQLVSLTPQLVNAACTLGILPDDSITVNNAAVFHSTWRKTLRVVTEALDDLTALEDVVAVLEDRILRDVNNAVASLRNGDVNSLWKCEALVRLRVQRLCDAIDGAMEGKERSLYTDQVMNALTNLVEAACPRFSHAVSNAEKNGESDEFVASAQGVYDAVREVRRAVLAERVDWDTDSEFEEEQPATQQVSTSGNSQSDRALMRQLPEGERARIAEQVAVFKEEKAKLDAEITKWDESGNDIILLAKRMCMVMMEMTDFTRGRGPLHHTMDVINAARRISEYGQQMISLATQIGDQCIESRTKSDLRAYLNNIALYTHQLNITSKVKADVTRVGDEMVVSGGLDSAMSLIQSAKNLMQAVVQTVKATYVASTKYKNNSHLQQNVVVWKMKAPQMKPLIKPPQQKPSATDSGELVNPIRELSEFRQGPTL